MKKSNTRRALLLSVISLLLCISMLIGTTYAWFTDTVTSAGNKIVAGTLKIDLQLLDKDTGIWNSIKENQDPIFTYEKWEPGYTDVKVLKVENLGTLALKWKACFLSETELGILADVIDVYVKPGVTAYPTDRVDLTGWKNAGTVREFAEGIESTTVGTLLKDQEATLGIALKMRESAGNEYQGEILEAFDIRIMATQLANESDSFDDQYDALAEYDGEITNMSGLQAALNNGGTYKLINDIDLTETVEGSASATTIIDLNGKKINNADGASIKNNGKLTIIDSAAGTSTFGLRARAVGGGISGTTTTVLYNYGELNLKAGTYGSESNYALRNYGKMALNKATVTSGILCSGADADLEITDSTVSNARTGTHVIYVGGSTVTINSGSFNNEIANNATILSSGGKVIIKDGTFSIGSKSYLFDGTGYEISGGTFNGGIRGTYTITGGEFNNANGSGYNIYTGTAISGGTFPADCKVENHLADGYAAIESGEEKIILPAGYELAGEGVLVNGNDYYIYNANGFLWVEAQADNFFAGKTVKLFNDIDCTDVAIKAIKFWNPENKTTFDGQNYTIYNLDISTAPSSGN